MGLKIHWQDVWLKDVPLFPELGEMWKGMDRLFKKVVDPDTSVSLAHVAKSGALIQYSYFEMLNDTYILDGIIKAGEKDFDAAVIGCCADPGLHQARSVMDIPVMASGESAMIVGQLIGRRFAMVTVGQEFVPIMEGNLRLLGLERRAIANRPIRSFEMKMEDLIDCFKGKPDRIIDQFEAVARECIKDGADVILAGCGYLGPALSLVDYSEIPGTGVPVVDGSAAALKLAEAMAGLKKSCSLKKSTSRSSIYASPPAKVLTSIRKNFGFV